MENYTYSFLIQKLTAIDNGKDENLFFKDYHSAIREAIETNTNERSKNDTESIQRAISRLRGTLIPYLSTPLKSDKDDIERSIKDTIEDVLTQIGSSSVGAETVIQSFRILETTQIPLHRQLVGVIKRLLKNGKSMLVDAGMLTGKNYGSVFLSYFSFEGFSHVQVVQGAIHRLKKNGIHKGLEILQDSLYEIILSHSSATIGNEHTIMLHFDAEEPAIEKLKTSLAALLDQFGIKGIQLGKRSFFSGFGSSYQLQIITDLKKHPLGTILLTVIAVDAELESALTEQGSLIVLEKIT